MKDLFFLGRNLKDVIIIDNSPNSYAFQIENALPIPSWYSDKSDTALYQLLPILHRLAVVDDVRMYLPRIVKNHKVNFSKAYKLLKISYTSNDDYEDYYDSGREMPTSEFEEGTKCNANTPKDNHYFKENPFAALKNKIEEQGNRTIDSSSRIADEVLCKKDVRESNPKRPMVNGWTENTQKRPTKINKNLSYNSSTMFNKANLEPDSDQSQISKYSNFVRLDILIN